MVSRDIILTGIPRSGTTLTCHLLNKLPDTVALHEPMRNKNLGASSNHEQICEVTAHFFRRTRQTLLESGRARSKHVAGVIPDNTVGEASETGGIRSSRISRGYIEINKPLSPGFALCIKHPALFTAVLGTMVNRFPCYAVVRSPLAVLASWNSVDMPVRIGRAPAAERQDRGLRRRLAEIEDRIDRQICLLSWFFGKYREVLPPENVLRYEKIIESHGRALSVVVPAANELSEELENKNRNPLYDHELMQRVAERLLNTDGEFWHFYSRESIEAQLEVPSR